MQKAIFPMLNMRITQGINEAPTHNGTMNIDLAGKDGDIETLYAPFKCVIKAIDKANANTVYIESTDKVICADGVIDYVSMSFSHDNYVGDLKVGQVIEQFQGFYQEGVLGATANHIHMRTARGKYQGGFYNSFKRWCLKNQIEPYKIFFLYKINVINDYGYKWITTDTPTYEVPKPKPIVYAGSSIIDYLNSKKIDSSFRNRKALASRYGIKLYIGTPNQNTNLLKKMRGF